MNRSEENLCLGAKDLKLARKEQKTVMVRIQRKDFGARVRVQSHHKFPDPTETAISLLDPPDTKSHLKGVNKLFIIQLLQQEHLLQMQTV